VAPVVLSAEDSVDAVRSRGVSILQSVTTPSASPADRSDEELARAYGEGDALSFEELVRRYM